MKTLILSIVCVLFCCIARGAESSWNVEVVPNANNKLKGTDKTYPDVITIKDGQITSQVSAKQGFAAGKVEMKQDAGKTTFTGDMISPKSGKNHYELVLTKEGLTGTMVWGKTGENGQPLQAEFTIKEKKK